MFKNERRWCPFHHVGGWAQRSINHHDQKYCLYQSWRVVVFLEVSTWIKLSMWWLFMNKVKNRQERKPAGQILVLFLHGTDQKTTSLALLNVQIKRQKSMNNLEQWDLENLCNYFVIQISQLVLYSFSWCIDREICVRSNWRLSQLISKDVDGNMM
jgi:hypothetical protein